MADEISGDTLDDMLSSWEADPIVKEPVETKDPLAEFEDTGDSFDVFQESTGIQQQSAVPQIAKPWMKYHTFIRVKTVEEVEHIVEEAILNGHCSLDLETEGFDNRIEYDEAGKPHTVHQIVGICISVGDAKTGYYIPIRHRPEDDDEDQNVKPLARVEDAIRRLCLAAQPTSKPGLSDPLSFKEFETPPKVIIDFWNAKFDQEFLFPITGIDWWHPDSFEDGLLACFVLYTDDKRLGLKPKSKEKLRDPDGNPYEMIELKELFLKGRPITFYTLAPDEEGVLNYACSDAVCTRLLCSHPDIIPKVKSKSEWSFTYRLEKQVSQVVRAMERNRVKVDRTKIKVLLDENNIKREDLRKQIVELAASKGFHGFEPNSPKQLSAFLFGEQGLNITPKPEKTKTEQYKTDADTLEALTKENPNAPEVLKWIVSFRGYEKLDGTYLEGLYNNPDKNDCLRFDFKQTGAATGRFSAPAREKEHGFAAIPIHGIPKGATMRAAFITHDGYTMIKSDYAGQELRIACNASGEPVWTQEFLHGDGDLHSITARAFFGKEKVTKEERSMGKTANFALIYGGGPASIIRATGCDKMEAHRRKAAFDKAVPTFAKWVKGQHAKVKRDLGIWNPFGRWIAIPDANIKEGDTVRDGSRRVSGPEANAIRAACERHACNYPIQSGGADVMKIAMVLLHKEFYKRGWLKTGGDDSVRMLMTVHDEIVFEVRHAIVPEVLVVIQEQMALPGRLPHPPHSPLWQIPLIVDPQLGLSWGSPYEYNQIRDGKVEKPSPDEKLKPHEIRVGDRIYHRVPPWLVGILHAGYEAQPEPTAGLAPEQPPPTPGSPPEGPPPAPETPPEAPPTPPATPTAVATPSAPTEAAVGILTFRIKTLNRWSVRKVRGALMEYIDQDHGKLVRLLDKFGRETILDPAMGIRVKPKVVDALCEIGLTDGRIEAS